MTCLRKFLILHSLKCFSVWKSLISLCIINSPFEYPFLLSVNSFSLHFGDILGWFGHASLYIFRLIIINLKIQCWIIINIKSRKTYPLTFHYFQILLDKNEIALLNHNFHYLMNTSAKLPKLMCGNVSVPLILEFWTSFVHGLQKRVCCCSHFWLVWNLLRQNQQSTQININLINILWL